MTEQGGKSDGADGSAAHQLLCTHRFVRSTDAPPCCVHCGLGYAEYVHGTVRGALSRTGAWD